MLCCCKLLMLLLQAARLCAAELFIAQITVCVHAVETTAAAAASKRCRCRPISTQRCEYRRLLQCNVLAQVRQCAPSFARIAPVRMFACARRARRTHRAAVCELVCVRLCICVCSSRGSAGVERRHPTAPASRLRWHSRAQNDKRKA